MTFDQLRILETVVQLGGVLPAAKAMNRAQPAVSSAIKRLENEFEIQLFSRENYRLELTKEGHFFYKQASKIIREAEFLDGLAMHLKRGDEAEFKVSFEAISSISNLLTILKKAAEKFPSTKFTFNEDVMLGGFEKLHEGEVDVVIGPNLGTDFSFEKFQIAEVNAGHVCSPKMLKGISNKNLSLDDLREFPQIIMHETTKRRDENRHATVKHVFQWSVPNFTMKKTFLLNAIGWGGMPYHLIEEELKKRELVLLDLKISIPSSIPIYAFRKKNELQGNVSKFFWKKILALEIKQ